MWLGSTRYRKIRIVFALTVAVFFAAGATTEYLLSRMDMHTEEYIGNYLWNFIDRQPSITESAADFIIAVSHDFSAPVIFCLIILLFSFTVYAPAVSFSVAAYAAFTFGSVCIKTVSTEIDYMFRAAVLAASSVAIAELCVYSAYLGRELSHRSPPSTKLLLAMPEVREMFILLCTCACKLLIFIIAYNLITPRL